MSASSSGFSPSDPRPPIRAQTPESIRHPSSTSNPPSEFYARLEVGRSPESTLLALHYILMLHQHPTWRNLPPNECHEQLEQALWSSENNQEAVLLAHTLPLLQNSWIPTALADPNPIIRMHALHVLTVAVSHEPETVRAGAAQTISVMVRGVTLQKLKEDFVKSQAKREHAEKDLLLLRQHLNHFESLSEEELQPPNVLAQREKLRAEFKNASISLQNLILEEGNAQTLLSRAETVLATLSDPKAVEKRLAQNPAELRKEVLTLFESSIDPLPSDLSVFLNSSMSFEDQRLLRLRSLIGVGSDDAYVLAHYGPTPAEVQAMGERMGVSLRYESSLHHSRVDIQNHPHQNLDFLVLIHPISGIVNLLYHPTSPPYSLTSSGVSSQTPHVSSLQVLESPPVSSMLSAEEVDLLEVIAEEMRSVPESVSSEEAAQTLATTLLWLSDREGGLLLQELPQMIDPRSTASWPTLALLFRLTAHAQQRLLPQSAQNHRLALASASLTEGGPSCTRAELDTSEEVRRLLGTLLFPRICGYRPPLESSLNRSLIEEESSLLRSMRAAIKNSTLRNLLKDARCLDHPLASIQAASANSNHQVVFEWTGQGRILRIWNSGDGAPRSIEKSPQGEPLIYPATEWTFANDDDALLAEAMLSLYELTPNIPLFPLLGALSEAKRFLGTPCKSQRGPTCVAKSWAFYLKVGDGETPQEPATAALTDTMAVALAAKRASENTDPILSSSERFAILKGLERSLLYRIGKSIDHAPANSTSSITPALRRIGPLLLIEGLNKTVLSEPPEPVDIRYTSPFQSFSSVSPPASKTTGPRQFFLVDKDGVHSVPGGSAENVNVSEILYPENFPELAISSSESGDIWGILIDASPEVLSRAFDDRPSLALTMTGWEPCYHTCPGDLMRLIITILRDWIPPISGISDLKLRQEDAENLKKDILFLMLLFVKLRVDGKLEEYEQLILIESVQSTLNADSRDLDEFFAFIKMNGPATVTKSQNILNKLKKRICSFIADMPNAQQVFQIPLKNSLRHLHGLSTEELMSLSWKDLFTIVFPADLAVADDVIRAEMHQNGASSEHLLKLKAIQRLAQVGLWLDRTIGFSALNELPIQMSRTTAVGTAEEFYDLYPDFKNQEGSSSEGSASLPLTRLNLVRALSIEPSKTTNVSAPGPYQLYGSQKPRATTVHRVWMEAGSQETFGFQSAVRRLSEPTLMTVEQLHSLLCMRDPVGTGELAGAAALNDSMLTRASPEDWRHFLENASSTLSDSLYDPAGIDHAGGILVSLGSMAHLWRLRNLAEGHSPDSPGRAIYHLWTEALSSTVSNFFSAGVKSVDIADGLFLWAIAAFGPEPSLWALESKDLLMQILCLYPSRWPSLRYQGSYEVAISVFLEALSNTKPPLSSEGTVSLPDQSTFSLKTFERIDGPKAPRRPTLSPQDRAFMIKGRSLGKHVVERVSSFSIVLDRALSIICDDSGSYWIEAPSAFAEEPHVLKLPVSRAQAEKFLTSSSGVYAFAPSPENLPKKIEDYSRANQQAQDLVFKQLGLMRGQDGWRTNCLVMYHLDSGPDQKLKGLEILVPLPNSRGLDYTLIAHPPEEVDGPWSFYWKEPGSSPIPVKGIWNAWGETILDLGEGHYVMPGVQTSERALRLEGNCSSSGANLRTPEGWIFNAEALNSLPPYVQQLQSSAEEIAIPVRRGDQIGLLYGEPQLGVTLLELQPITRELLPTSSQPVEEAGIAFLSSLARHPELAAPLAPILQGRSHQLPTFLGDHLYKLRQDSSFGLLTKRLLAKRPPPHRPVEAEEALSLPSIRWPSVDLQPALEASSHLASESDVLPKHLEKLKETLGQQRQTAVQAVLEWWSARSDIERARFAHLSTSDVIGTLLHLWAQAEQVANLCPYAEILKGPSEEPSAYLALKESLSELHQKLSSLASLSIQFRLLDRIHGMNPIEQRSQIHAELLGWQQRIESSFRAPGSRALLLIEWLRDIQAYPHQIELLGDLCNPTAPSRMITAPMGSGKSALLLTATALEFAARTPENTHKPTLLLVPDALLNDAENLALRHGMALIGAPLPSERSIKWQDIANQASICAKQGLPLLLSSSQYRLAFASMIVDIETGHVQGGENINPSWIDCFLGATVIADEGDQAVDANHSFNVEKSQGHRPLPNSVVTALCSLLKSSENPLFDPLSEDRAIEIGVSLIQGNFSQTQKMLLSQLAFGVYRQHASPDSPQPLWIRWNGPDQPPSPLDDQTQAELNDLTGALNNPDLEPLAAFATFVRYALPALKQMRYGTDFGPAREDSLEVVPYHAANWPTDERFVDPQLNAAVAYAAYSNPLFWTPKRTSVLFERLRKLKEKPAIARMIEEMIAKGPPVAVLQEALNQPGFNPLLEQIALILVQTEVRLSADRVSVPAAALALTAERCLAVTGTPTPPSALPFGLHRGDPSYTETQLNAVRSILQESTCYELADSEDTLVSRLETLARQQPSNQRPHFFLDPQGLLHGQDLQRTTEVLRNIHTSDEQSPLVFGWSAGTPTESPELELWNPDGSADPLSAQSIGQRLKVGVFGQAQCRGTDIPRREGEIAWILLADDLSIGERDLLQTALRMRGLISGEQRVAFVIDKTLAQRIEGAEKPVEALLSAARINDERLDRAARFSALEADLRSFELVLGTCALLSKTRPSNNPQNPLSGMTARLTSRINAAPLNDPSNNPQNSLFAMTARLTSRVNAANLSDLVNHDRVISVQQQLLQRIDVLLNDAQDALVVLETSSSNDTATLAKELFLLGKFRQLQEKMDAWRSWILSQKELANTIVEPISNSPQTEVVREVQQEQSRELSLEIQAEVQRQLARSRGYQQPVSSRDALRRSIRTYDEVPVMTSPPDWGLQIYRSFTASMLNPELLMTQNGPRSRSFEVYLEQSLANLHISPGALYALEKTDDISVPPLNSPLRPEPILFWTPLPDGSLRASVLGPYEASCFLTDTDRTSWETMQRDQNAGNLIVTDIRGQPLHSYNNQISAEIEARWSVKISEYQEQLIRLRALYGDASLRFSPDAMKQLENEPLWWEALLNNQQDPKTMASLIAARAVLPDLKI